MKKIKVLITIILLLFCFVLNSELYQSYLTGFTSDFSYLQVAPDEESFEEMFTYIDEISQSTKTPFFFIKTSYNALGEACIDIYCSQNAYEMLTNHYQLSNGVFKGALTGKTTVAFHDLKSAEPTMEDTKLYMSGENYELINIHEKINRRYTTGYIHEDDSHGEMMFSIGMWALIGLFYLLISVLDLGFRKKEIFVKISLGMSKYKVIFLNAFFDGVVLFLSAFTLRAVLKSFFYIDFNFSAIVIALSLMVIFNFFIYLSICKINYKEIIYGGNIGEKTVSNCYLVKVVSMVLTVTLISVNLGLIIPNIEPLLYSGRAEKYESLSFASLSQGENAKNEIPHFGSQYGELLSESFKKKPGKFSINTPFTGGKRDFVITNDLSLLLKSGITDFENKGESFIVLPYNYDQDEETKEFLLETCSRYVEDTLGVEFEEIPFNILYATKPSRALYFDIKDESNAKLGYATAKNPVFIYCNTNNIAFESFDENKLHLSNGYNVMYETDYLNNSFSFLDENEINLEMTSAKTIFNNNKTSLTQTLLLSLTIILLQMLIDIFLIFSLIKIEYRANAVELSVKKLMGYSILSKNKALFFLNIYSALIGIMTAVVIFFLLQIDLKLAAVISGGVVMAIESLIMMWAINRFEKNNVIKIIKGGAL